MLFAQGWVAEARQILALLHEDLCVVYRPDDEMTAEIAEALASIRLDSDDEASSNARHGVPHP
ncbi:hypothetical protein [Streptomyces sp. NBC_00435]|uniref:hypothetical protein n=1 Tax=Streptomyces sp. NBC_00435 TaxID=2903649 RepID=UPI002E1AAEB3